MGAFGGAPAPAPPVSAVRQKPELHQTLIPVEPLQVNCKRSRSHFYIRPCFAGLQNQLQDRLHVKLWQTGVPAAAPASEPPKSRSLEQFGCAGATKTWICRLRPRLRDLLPALPSWPLRALDLQASPSGGGGRMRRREPERRRKTLGCPVLLSIFNAREGRPRPCGTESN